MEETGFHVFKLSNAGYCCAQIVMKMALDEEGTENEDLIRALNGLCMGIGNSQKTCGILTGGIAVLGLYAGKGNERETQKPGYSEMIKEWIEWFRTEFGSTECADLIGTHSVQEYRAHPEYRLKCGDMLIKSYDKLREILQEHNYELGSREL